MEITTFYLVMSPIVIALFYYIFYVEMEFNKVKDKCRDMENDLTSKKMQFVNVLYANRDKKRRR